ncbi:hypothetical protein CVT25_011527 [Psilocybe cyanescens]|uniref:Uncharacterized protein n=1 Tax=Psilocybe cyanescens TaxID=93625 RepID=A0A409XV18_PSICY|nr:hypothetical protein CVT25_011527 [Psilocybe cyanescens]
MHEDNESVLSILNAATNDLATLINNLLGPYLDERMVWIDCMRTGVLATIAASPSLQSNATVDSPMRCPRLILNHLTILVGPHPYPHLSLHESFVEPASNAPIDLHPCHLQAPATQCTAPATETGSSSSTISPSAEVCCTLSFLINLPARTATSLPPEKLADCNEYELDPNNVFSVPVIISPVVLTNGREIEALDLDVGVAYVTHSTRVSTRAIRKPFDTFNNDDVRTSETARWVVERTLLSIDIDCGSSIVHS